MASFIDPLIAFVSAHAWLAYLTLFLAALLEAVPIVGSVIPGSTIILALSALVPGGELRLEWVLAAAVAGALLGDGSAFWIGHRAQREILNAWPMANYPGVVAQSEAFFHRWGALAVFFARFVPPIRAFVPITAGALGMPPLRFYPVNTRRSCYGRRRMCCRACLRYRRWNDTADGWASGGTAKHYWMPLVIGGALILALAIWVIRRRHGGGVIEPATAGAQGFRTVRSGDSRLRTCRRPHCARAPGRYSGRGGGSVRHAAIARRHGRSIRRCAPSRTAPVRCRAAGPAYAPAPRAHSRC